MKDFVECIYLEICHAESCEMFKSESILEYPFMNKYLLAFLGGMLCYLNIYLSSAGTLLRRLQGRNHIYMVGTFFVEGKIFYSFPTPDYT